MKENVTTTRRIEQILKKTDEVRKDVQNLLDEYISKKTYLKEQNKLKLYALHVATEHYFKIYEDEQVTAKYVENEKFMDEIMKLRRR